MSVLLAATTSSVAPEVQYPGALRDYAEDSVALPAANIQNSESKTITINDDSRTVDFQNGMLAQLDENDFVLQLSNGASSNTIQNLTIDCQLTAGNRGRREGIRDDGSGNTFEDITVKNIAPGSNANGCFSSGDLTGSTWRRVDVIDAGYSCFRLRPESTVENCTGHYTAASRDYDYGGATRPRWLVGGRDQTNGSGKITIKDSTFTSLGQFCHCVFDAPVGRRLGELYLENVTFDNRGAVFSDYAESPNNRSMFKVDNVELIHFKNVTFLYDETTLSWGPHFISCGKFIAEDCNFDTYPVIFTVTGIREIELYRCNFGVNKNIQRCLDIGPESGSNRLLETFTSLKIRDCVASNIIKNEGLYLKTDGTTVTVDIDGLTLNFNHNNGSLALDNGNVVYALQENIVINGP